MPRVFNPYTRQLQMVSSAVRVGLKGSKRWESYCARSARIAGRWKSNPKAKNLIQRRRWKCPYVAGELRVSEYRRRKYGR
jgi:hypothetical protein